MAKIKCDKHDRRVIAVNGRFIHRGGWGEVCDSETATVDKKRYTAKEIQEGVRHV